MEEKEKERGQPTGGGTLKERAQRILDAVEELTLRWGYSKTTIDDIAKQAGVAKRPTRKQLVERGEAWRPFRTFATWYMWYIRRLAQGNNRDRTRIVSL